VWLRSFQAVDDLATLVRNLRIRCQFRSRRALYLAGNTLGPTELADEGLQRRAIGLPSAFLGHATLRSLAGIDREAALLSDGAADVNPVLLTRGLLRRAIARGARVYSPAQLSGVVPSPRKVEMVTSDNIELEAKALVFATGYELAEGVPSHGHRIVSTWAFSTRPQPKVLWSKGELIWEAADPYLYIRTTVDGRVVVGGEDEDIEDATARDALLPAKLLALQQKTKHLLPWLDVSADCAWAGTFGESDSGLPSIGSVPGMPNCYAVLGYGGNGITFGVVAAQIIAGRLCGCRDRDERLFAFKA
jgi:glycine/D-amino acid oxidase-like deaminating enzyme